jgi:hypothetical protein
VHKVIGSLARRGGRADESSAARMVLGQPVVRRKAAGDAWQENGCAAVAGVSAHPAEAVARVRAGAEIGRAGVEGVAWERREEGGVGEVPQGTDYGLLRVDGTGGVYGRGGERGALRANAAVEECEEESPEGDVAVHRAES